MGTFQAISDNIFCFLEGIIILLLFLLVNNKKDFIKNNKIKTVVFIILYTLFSNWATTYIPGGLHSVCITVFVIIVLSFVTQSNVYVSAISVAIIFITMLLVEISVLMAEMIFFRIDLNMITSDPTLKLYHSAIIKILQMGAAILLFRTNINIFKLNIFKKENSFLSFAILQIFMMGTFILSLNYVVSHQTNIVLYNILLFAIYILFIFLGFLDYRERERILKLKHKFEAQEEYVENMETVMNILRREKHDFANHLNTIFAMSMLGKPDTTDKIQMYIKKLTDNLTSSYQFFDTGNDFVDGLLAVKSNFAFEHDIHLEVDIEEPFGSVLVNDSDLTSIMGNIIDNAFEAIMEQGDKEGKVVSICTFLEDKDYYLSISDNGPMIPRENMDKIFENGFSTKTIGAKEHGFGLYIVKQLVKKNHGEITVKSSQQETEFLIKFRARGCKDDEQSSSSHYQGHTQGKAQSHGLAN